MVNRNNTTDSIKGIMIILVVFGHIIYQGSYQELFQSIRDIIYIFHMPIFLMLSGFYFKFRLTIDWLENLTTRLVYPYLISFSFYLLTLYIVGQWGGIETSNNISDFQSAFKAILISPFSSYWYLHSLIAFSLLFFVSNFLCSRLDRMHLILPLSLVIYSIFHFILWNINVKFFYWVASYIWLGYVFGGFLNNYRFRNDNYSPMIVLVFLLIINSMNIISGFDLYRTAISLTLYFSLYMIFKYFHCGFLSFIGRNSLLIFLFHVYFLNVSKFFSGIIINLDFSGLLYVVFSLALSIFGSIIVGWIFDKLKISKYVLGTNNAIK